eukprot:m.250698 g.250698  ORF g.250698 m.250698 type:complete len:367 (+) comp16857_c0_seq1:142-1242(+)
MAAKRREIGQTLSKQPPTLAWDRSCCSARPATVYRVRQGPDYKRNGKKAPSGPEMYDQIGFDVYRSPNKQLHLAAHTQMPKLPPGQDTPVAGVPPIFIVNFMLPNYEPPNPLWGTPITDGPGFGVVSYFLMKESTRAALNGTTPATPAHRLLQRLVAYEEERVRMKAILNVLNAAELNFSSALASLINQYNMKPILTRPQHRFFTDYKTYFELDVDIHIFGYVGRRGLFMLMPLVNKVAADAGFVVEGWDDDELPENILFRSHIHGVNFETAEELDLPFLPSPPPPAEGFHPPLPHELHPLPSPGPDSSGTFVFPGSAPSTPMPLAAPARPGLADDWESSDDEAPLMAEEVEVYSAAIVARLLPEE